MTLKTLARFVLPLMGVLGLGAALTAPALADPSAYGCRNLDRNELVASVEGKDGYFFRIFADLRMQNIMTDGSIAEIAAVSKALKAHGTTLIYAPIPTKGQTLGLVMPDDAHLYGFDPKVAIDVYEDQIKRLNAAGVLTVDLVPALTMTDLKHPTFFQADFHWTSEGAERSAQAIADVVKKLPDYADVKPVTFKTTSQGEAVGISSMRRALQPYCVDSLPLPRTVTYVTQQVDSGDASAAADIFGDSSSTGGDITLVGTSFSDATPQNFGGFLSQYTGMPVSNVSVTGGNQFGSVTSYITSKEFADSRPRYLIWENPVYNSLSEFGPAPMDELAAAAADACMPVAPAALKVADDGNVSVDMQGVSIPPGSVLMADAGNEESRSVDVAFRAADGTVFSQSLQRNDRQRGTGRFYLPLDLLEKPNVARIDIKFDRVTAQGVAVKVCGLNQG